MISILVYILYRMVMMTTRIREVCCPEFMQESFRLRRPMVLAHWHGEEWMLLRTWGKRHMAVLSSHSQDGERMAKFMNWLGFKVYRGSSSKGGAAGLRALVRAVKNDFRTTSLAVDGPKGPRQIVKPGIVQLAKLTGEPIIPMVGACSKAWILKNTWNQATIPKPFSKIVIMYGPPLFIDQESSTKDMEKSRAYLEKCLTQMSQSALLWL